MGIYLKPKQAAGRKDPLFEAVGADWRESNPIKRMNIIEWVS